MKRATPLFFLVFGFIFDCALGQSYIPAGSAEVAMKVKSKPLQAYPFAFEDVQLKESVFKDAMDADIAYLKVLDPDRFLSQFRTNAGLEAKGDKYGGWENEGLAGHSLGHYLSACSINYAVTKDKFFLERVTYIIDELAECQNARGTGYVGAIPNEDKIFYEVAVGKINTGGFSLNGGWAPWYTIHKIMAGLMDAYLYTGNEKALQVNQGIADWAGKLVRGLTYDEMQTMLRCEYGGMNEALSNTYTLTGDIKYLELANRFHDNFVVDSLEAKINPLPGKHSNTNIPKAVASIRNYEVTGEDKKKIAAKFLWETVVDHHTYAPGGNGNYEYFGKDDDLGNQLTDNTMETCATYNMLKLTQHLFGVEPSSKYMDYYERALYNHILASQNRENGMSCYFMPLRMGTKKEFSDEFNSFTCCVGTTMENHVRYGEAIYSHAKDGGLFVNLFIPSELNWKEREAKVVLETELPKTNTVTLAIETTKKQEFSIYIRKPYWAEGEVVIKVNNKRVEVSDKAIDGYLSLKRKWRNTDKIAITLPLGIHTMAMPDDKDRKAFFYGPIILAGDLGKEEPEPGIGTPVFVTEVAEPKEWIKEDRPGSLVFKSVGAGKPKEVVFKPFYNFTDHYYSVYFDVFTPSSWAKQKKKYEEEKMEERALADRTVSLFRVGEMQPERDHNFIGENARAGTEHTRKYRISGREEAMRFTMKVDSQLKNSIILTYWGMDNRYRKFGILIDGEKVGKEDLNKFKESRFYDVTYPIPPKLTQDKETVVVTLKPDARCEAGPIYGVRMVKEKL